MHTPMITKVSADDLDDLDSEYPADIPELKNQEILYKCAFLDGTLYVLKGLVPLQLDIIIESFDIIYKDSLILDSNRPLSEILNPQTVELIKLSYLNFCIHAKNEDVTHGISSVH